MAEYYPSDPNGNYHTQPATGNAPPIYTQSQQPYGSQPPPNPYQTQAPQPPETLYPPPPPPPTFQESTSGKFSKSAQFKDIWASMFFFVHLCVYSIAVYFGLLELLAQIRNPTSFLNRPAETNGNSVSEIPSSGLARTLAITLGSSVGAAAVFSLIYFLCIQRFTGKMIHVTFIIAILIFALFAAYTIYVQKFAGGIIVGFFVLIYALMYYGLRSRIPFAKVLLRSVCNVTNKYPGMLAVAICGLVVSILYNALWFAALIGWFLRFTANDQSLYGVLYAIIFGLVFSLYYPTFCMCRKAELTNDFCLFFSRRYWTTQVIYNTIHVSISGVFATYYFLGTATAGGEIVVSVNHPVTASSKRALTVSFGSICFGSLVLALLQTIRFIVQSLTTDSLRYGNPVGYCFVLCFGCCLQFFEDLVQYFNTYAFAQVAIYGKDFSKAAKDTWALIKTRGIDAIINDNLIGNVLFVGSMVAGLICGLIGYFYLLYTTPNATPGVYTIVIVGCILVGLSEFGVLNTVIDSGVVTTFVCLYAKQFSSWKNADADVCVYRAEDPERGTEHYTWLLTELLLTRNSNRQVFEIWDEAMADGVVFDFECEFWGKYYRIIPSIVGDYKAVEAAFLNFREKYPNSLHPFIALQLGSYFES
ncbi:putative choline transporter, neither null mutation nor overexpression affects choline transport [Nowakowskiella sp. JEL0407]|nr:putative choline transporter, neither null mutation nor overexpression affects choline transport [Nowakowskiella sp. JEL0407]